MSILASNQTEIISRSLLNGASSFLGSCFSAMGSLTSSIPDGYLLTGGLLLTAGVASIYLCTQSTASMNDKVAQFVRDCIGKPAKEVTTKIQSFID